MTSNMTLIDISMTSNKTLIDMLVYYLVYLVPITTYERISA